jgi:hypothetical protein
MVGENDFELSITPFLGLHLVFNVEFLRPYFQPLLDTLDAVEQLAQPFGVSSLKVRVLDVYGFLIYILC